MENKKIMSFTPIKLFYQSVDNTLEFYPFEVKLIEGSVKSTFNFACSDIQNGQVPQPLLLKDEVLDTKKKRMISKSPLPYHSNKISK